jgi:mannose-6-phosphate isomerase-like protein (cupin superfamily)
MLARICPETALAACLFAASAAAADVDIFTVKDIGTMTETLAAKGPAFADKNIARYGNHYLLLARRGETGSSELHEHEADIFVVESGAATIVTGGKIVKPQTAKPGEIRGSSIEGGERHALAAGDIIHIPAGTPHQLLIEKGTPFAYFVVKVTGQ